MIHIPVYVYTFTQTLNGCIIYAQHRKIYIFAYLEKSGALRILGYYEHIQIISVASYTIYRNYLTYLENVDNHFVAAEGA